MKDSSKIQPGRTLIDHPERKYQKVRHLERRTETRTIHKSPVKIKNCEISNYSHAGIYVVRSGTNVEDIRFRKINLLVINMEFT